MSNPGTEQVSNATSEPDPLYLAILDAITDMPPDQYALCGLTAEVAANAVRAFLGDDGRHVIEFRENGWTIRHPIACRPKLFECPLNQAAVWGPPPAGVGRYACAEHNGDLIVLDRLGDLGE